MSTESKKKWQKVVAKAWMDEGYKQRLLKDPNVVLQEEGIEIPEGINFRVMEDSEKVRTLILPWPKVKEDNVDELEERLAAFGYIGF
jgi:nitrile hydratase alpha subunit